MCQQGYTPNPICQQGCPPFRSDLATFAVIDSQVRHKTGDLCVRLEKTQPLNHVSDWQCKIRKFTVTAFHCEESTHRK